MQEWPPIADLYTDEQGEVDALVYETAGDLWLQAKALALSTLGDESEGHHLLLKAVVSVSKKMAEENIRNLPDYLFAAYRNNVRAELEKRRLHEKLKVQRADELSPVTIDPREAEKTALLIAQLCQRMDKWTKDVFEWRTLGYTSEEIGVFLGMSASHVRSKYDKSLTKLQKQIAEDTRKAAAKAAEAGSLQALVKTPGEKK